MFSDLAAWLAEMGRFAEKLAVTKPLATPLASLNNRTMPLDRRKARSRDRVVEDGIPNFRVFQIREG